MKYPLIFILMISSCLPANAQYEAQIKGITQEIGNKVAETSKKRIAVADFMDANGVVTKLGQFLSEEFNTALPEYGQGFQVIDRSRLNDLMRENKLGSLTDPETVVKLGKLAGIEALIYGTITPLGESVRVNIKILDIQRAVILRSLAGNITRTADINGLLVETTNPNNPSNLSETPGITNNTASNSTCTGVNAAGVTLVVKECRLVSNKIVCQLLVSNQRLDKADAKFDYHISNTYLITDTGNQYTSSNINIADTSSPYYHYTSSYNSINGVNVSGKIEFNVQETSIKKLQIFEMKDQGLRCQNLTIVSPK